MVAQLDRVSLEKVVQDGDPTRGLVGCEFRPRRNSSDHGPQSRLRDWDFLLVRSDGSVVRLHIDWNKPKIPTFAVQGHDEPVEIPLKGLGKSDGKGTFNKCKIVGRQETLRFGRTRGALV